MIDSLAGVGLFLTFLVLMVGIFAMTMGFIIGKFHGNQLDNAFRSYMRRDDIHSRIGGSDYSVGNEDPAAGYGATYLFAIFGMVLFTIILLKYLDS